jgi:hypothetical protein
VLSRLTISSKEEYGNGEFKALHSELRRSMSIGHRKKPKEPVKRIRKVLVMPIIERKIEQKLNELRSFLFCSIFVSMIAQIDKKTYYK